MNQLFRLFCMLVWLTVSNAAVASEYHGQVTLGGLPVPGATVTAVQGDKKVAAVSDTQGVFSFADLADGSWTVQVEMTGFAPIKQEVTVAPSAAAVKWELKLMSLDQIRAAAKPLQVRAAAAPVVAAASTPAAPGTGAPAAAKAGAKAAAKPGDSNVAAAAPVAALPPADDSSSRPADSLVINGSQNNAASSPFSQAQAFGNTRNGGRSLYSGGLTFFLDNSALDAKQYSITGLDSPKPSFNNMTIGINLLGPIKIPHLLKRGPDFFLNYMWVRRNNNQTLPYLVPTIAERNGDLTGLLNPLGQPVQVINPATGKPFPGNIAPLSPQAMALLSYYPLPNITGNTRYNYQLPIINDTHQDAFNVRISKSIGQRNQVFGTFALSSSRSGAANLFNFVDTTNTLGLNSSVHWSHRFRQRLFMNASYTFSRGSTRVTPFFQNRQNVSGMAGITGNDQTVTNWGPPSLSFSSSGIAGLNDAISSFTRSETNGLSMQMSWNRIRHNVSFGADFRRQEFNYFGQQNPRGSFGFTGAATQGSAVSTTTTGSDFADFLLGVPDTSSIAYGNADKYFRQSIYDAFITDDWRVRPELTINAGMRWEYSAPISELYGRLVNLDVAPGFTKVAQVLGSSPVGPLTNQAYPTSLVRQDKGSFQPRIGISWRPISGSSVLVGAGYGITQDTSVYQSIATNMAQQAPLSTSLSVQNSLTCPLTLASGFHSCSSITPNTFAIDPNFRVGYAQTWKLSVQRDLPFSLQLITSYLGIKGTRGEQQFLPNTYPTGSADPCPSCPSGFYYRASNGNSTKEAGTVWLRRRLRSGFTASVQYTFSKALDDDSTFGGGGGSVQTAQDWRNLNGERGLSTFDQRHLMNTHLEYTTGMGIGGRTLMSGWRGTVYKEWTFVTNITIGSGLPETPVYSSTVSGSGVIGPIRPNVVPGQPIHLISPGVFLNAAAFTAPNLAAGQWGNARRNSITGPGTFTLNASMQRSFRLHDRFNLNARLDANNVLNHVVYTGWNTTINSSLYGSPQNAGGMRTVTATMSLRF